MKTALFLLSVGSAFCFTSYNPYYPYNSYNNNNNQNVNVQSSTLDGILARASPQAVGAYSQIVQNFSQSLADVKSALENWSKTYGLEQEYKKFVADSEKENADFKKAITELFPKLTKFFNDYFKIGDDKKQSIMLAYNKTAALTSTLDDKQKAAIEFIMKTYMPSLLNAIPSNQGSTGGLSGNIGIYPGYNGGLSGNNGIYPGNNGGYSQNGGNAYNGGYTGSNGGYQGNPGGFPGMNGMFPVNTGTYPGNSGGFPQNNGGYAGNNGGYQGNFQENNGGFPNNNGMYPANSGVYQGSTGGFPGTNGGFSNSNGGFQNNNGGFPVVNNNGRMPLGNSGLSGYATNQGGYQGQNGVLQGFNMGIPNSNGNNEKRPSFGSNAVQGK
ncbi:unnamed protein product [Strongylus vulgaris]|uniref:SXP/RAL-2 family protein Ani s 5-like cation-binding domain-containing protein n=1 Tax=Strongylus vulgaris TaxID=40348 RepID=A0A3P7JIR5_STRVU|nr:unnamed protein product [Strongylus vulgaris]